MIKLLRWLFSLEGSTVIQNLGLGIGGFFRSYREKYPKELEGSESGWELTHNPDRRGHLYLLDHRDKTRRWIANYRTFQDLFINVPSFGDSYKDADHILTVGEPEP